MKKDLYQPVETVKGGQVMLRHLFWFGRGINLWWLTAGAGCGCVVCHCVCCGGFRVLVVLVMVVPRFLGIEFEARYNRGIKQGESKAKMTTLRIPFKKSGGWD